MAKTKPKKKKPPLKLLGRYKYKGGDKLIIYNNHICFFEHDEHEKSDRWFFLSKFKALQFARNILSRYEKEKHYGKAEAQNQ